MPTIIYSLRTVSIRSDSAERKTNPKNEIAQCKAGLLRSLFRLSVNARKLCSDSGLFSEIHLYQLISRNLGLP